MAGARERPRAFRRIDVVVIALFLAAILAPTVDSFVRDDDVRGPGPELRTAAKIPKWSNTQAAISAWPAGYEAHFSDTVGLRDVLMRGNSIVKYYVFGQSPGANQIVGRDGWIYYSGDASVEVYRGLLPFAPGLLERWAQELETRRVALAAGGIRYLFVIVPNKETIYPERMPDGTSRVGPTRLDAFYEYVREHTSVEVLDLRPALLADRVHDTGPMDALYSPHGTHWTARGTMVVYRELVERVAALFPGTTYVPPEEFEIVASPYGFDTFAINLYLEGILRQPGSNLARRGGRQFQVVEHFDAPPRWRRAKASGEHRLPHTLVCHDSFGPFIYNLLAESFAVLDTHEGEYDRRRVDVGETKLVIEMFVERYLVNHAPNSSRDERVSSLPESFAAATHSLYTFDGTTATCEAIGGLETESVDTPDGKVLRISRRTAKEGLQTRAFRTPPHGDVLMNVVVATDVDATLEVMWHDVGDAGFDRTRRAQLTLRPGVKSDVVPLPATGHDMEILLRPSEVGAKVDVRAIEVRSVDAP